jgi:hypothetical protein
MSHARNTGAMQASQRCDAKTRAGSTCRAPAVRSRMRCRMHGGATGSGAPFGNGNALKHGFFTNEAVHERKFVRTVLQESGKLLNELEAELPTSPRPRTAL